MRPPLSWYLPLLASRRMRWMLLLLALCTGFRPLQAAPMEASGEAPIVVLRLGWSHETLRFRAADVNTFFALHPADGPFARLELRFALPGEAFIQTGIGLRQLRLRGAVLDANAGLPKARARMPALDLPLCIGWRIELPRQNAPFRSWALLPTTGLCLDVLGAGLESNLPDAPLRFVPLRPSAPRLLWENSLALEHRMPHGHRLQLSIHYAAGLLEGQRIGTLRWQTGDRSLQADVLSKGNHWRIGLAYGIAGKVRA